MEYKGYCGQVFYDDHAKIYHGEVISGNDIITFQGETLDQSKKAFVDSIEDYLSFINKDM